MSSDYNFSSARPTTSRPRKIHQPRGSNIHRADKIEKQSSGGSNSLSLQGQIVQVLAMVAVASLVATSGFKSVEWIKQQLKPFCHAASRSEAEGDCIPCPHNGLCPDGRLECLVGFKRAGRSCVEDKKIDQTAENLAGLLEDHVCGIAALAVCDGASEAVWVTDAEAQARLKERGLHEKLGLDAKAWTLVWEKSARIVGNSIVVTHVNLQGQQAFLCPSELVHNYKPVRCRIREWVVANLVTLFVTSPLLLLLPLFIRRYLSRKNLNARAEEVYVQVCEALEDKALESREMAGGESWVVVNRLRDHVLLPSERKWTSLWTQVEGFVQEDSRIDQYQRKVKGEMKIVWEWQVEGALRTARLRNKVHPNASI